MTKRKRIWKPLPYDAEIHGPCDFARWDNEHQVVAIRSYKDGDGPWEQLHLTAGDLIEKRSTMVPDQMSPAAWLRLAKAGKERMNDAREVSQNAQ